MDWKSSIIGFKAYLMLERSLSENSIEAYIRDVKKFVEFLNLKQIDKMPLAISSDEIELFIKYIHELGLGERSQSRMLSGLRSFYKFLLVENLVDDDPTALFQGPKLSRKLPEVLSVEEIDLLIEGLDLSHPQGHRNKAMLETLYACGLRVSELINLKISDFFIEEEYIKVTGKGDKERIVPITPAAITQNKIYIQHYRSHVNIQDGEEDFLYLNRRGKHLTRVMVFTIIKDLVAKVGIDKKVSPHTFRHSFATHLVEGGADLRAVQDMLGHESITTTEIYTHIDKKYLHETIMLYHPMSSKNYYNPKNN